MKSVTKSFNLFPLYMNMNLRFNPTNQGILKNTKNIPDIPRLSDHDFKEKDLSYDLCIKKTEELLWKNISAIKSKKIAIGLSGGTDSSLNTILLSRKDDISLKLFSIGFGDSSDEFKDARIVAKLVNRECKEIILKDIIDDLPLMIWKFGSPKSNLWPYYNSKTVKDLGANATLSGEGGDELFGGYFFRYLKYLESIPKTPFGRAKRYLYARSRDWIPTQNKIFGKNFKNNQKLIYSSKDLISYFNPIFKNNLSFLNQIFLADFNYKLRYDFNFVDTVFANKEDVRIYSPFLKPNIIHFATHIPHKYKLGKNTSKMILRDLLKKLGAPKKIYEKPKQGWGMKPTTIWNNGLRERCERFLFDGMLVNKGWINKTWIKETHSFIEQNKSKVDGRVFPYINKIWDVLSFEIFYLQRILKESRSGKISGW